MQPQPQPQPVNVGGIPLRPEVESCHCTVCRSDLAYLSECLVARPRPQPINRRY